MAESWGTRRAFDIGEHVAAFNAAVDSGTWGPFVERFTDDAVMEFEGVPAGPFVGKEEIAAAYAASPPDDMIEVAETAPVIGDELGVAFRWRDSGATGSMRFGIRDALVARLVIRFD